MKVLGKPNDTDIVMTAHAKRECIMHPCSIYENILCFHPQESITLLKKYVAMDYLHQYDKINKK